MATSLVVGLPCEIISALYYTLNAVRVHEKLCCAMWEYVGLSAGRPVSFGHLMARLFCQEESQKCH